MFVVTACGLVGGLVCCTRCYAEFFVSCYLHFVFSQEVVVSCPIYCTYNKRTAASLCSSGWHDSFEMMVSVKVGYL